MEGKVFLKLLIDELGTNPNKIAADARKPALQSSVQRFLAGDVENPRRKTLEPAAEVLGFNVEALFSTEIALKELKRLGIKVPGQAETAPSHLGSPPYAEPATRISTPEQALVDAGEFSHGSNFRRPRRPAATTEESLWRIAFEAGQIKDEKERSDIAELVRLVVDNPLKNASDQIPIIVRRLSGGSASSEPELPSTGSDP